MNKFFSMHRSVVEPYTRGMVEFQKMEIALKGEFIKSYQEKVNLIGSGFSGNDFFKIYNQESKFEKVSLCTKDEKQAVNFEYESKDEVEVLISRFGRNAFDNQVLYVLVGDEAHIRVSGVMHRGREIDSTYINWGYNSTYNEIMLATELSNLDHRVKTIVYDMNTPGGSTDGAEDAAKVIRDSKKPTRVDIWFWMMSGGLFLGSQADKRRAMSNSVQGGSLGVVYEWYDWSKWEKDVGIERKTVTSSNAPDKRPDGNRLIELLQKDADEMEEIFINYVATGLGKDKEYIKENFGKGWDLIAADALKVGMIDEIVQGSKEFTEDKFSNNMENFTMDITKLQNEHPEVYKEVFNLGMESGSQNEKDRVLAHLEWSNDAKIETVVENIKEGKPCDSACCKKYSDEAKANIIKKNREDEEPEADINNGEEPSGDDYVHAQGNMTESEKIEASANKLGINSQISSGKVFVIHK